MSEQQSPTKDFLEKVIAIQTELKAPKSQWNSFGKYNYRSLEDILDALKPLLSKQGLLLTIADSPRILGDNIPVIDVVATLTDGTSKIYATATAGIALNKKGMDSAQTFGASSSYARKYALNALFLIDDTKDADATNKHGKGGDPKPEEKKKKMTKAVLDAMISAIKDGRSEEVKGRIDAYTMTDAQKNKIKEALEASKE